MLQTILFYLPLFHYACATTIQAWSAENHLLGEVPRAVEQYCLKTIHHYTDTELFTIVLMFAGQTTLVNAYLSRSQPDI